MKRTLMFENREVLDFEVEPEAGRARVLDAPEADDEELAAIGLDCSDLNASVTNLVRSRTISANRVDLDEILGSFGANSALELALMGHGASLTDHFWYRAPGSPARWEDVNFFDNDWDGTFLATVLAGDYVGLSACSPEIPDVTTRGHLRKAWERRDAGIFLLKQARRDDAADLEGSLLASQLCALLFGRDVYQPLSACEVNGRRFSVSPLMLARDEELVQGYRLFAMCGMRREEADELAHSGSLEYVGDIFSRTGLEGHSAHLAKIATFKNLSLLNDIHSGNYGVICNVKTGERRFAPPFDYDRAFGFPNDECAYEEMCANPQSAALFCAYSFSDFEPSWDWGWYDPRALEGFEDRIVEAYAHLQTLPPNFGQLVARIFVIQRSYLNDVASAG